MKGLEKIHCVNRENKNSLDLKNVIFGSYLVEAIKTECHRKGLHEKAFAQLTFSPNLYLEWRGVCFFVQNAKGGGSVTIFTGCIPEIITIPP